MSLKNAKPDTRDVLHSSVALQVELSEAGVIARNDTYARAEQGDYNPGDVIRIFLPPNMSDFRDATLQFTAPVVNGVGAGGATASTIVKGIWSIFNRARIFIGSTAVVDMNRFNICAQMKSLLWKQNYAQQYGKVAEGLIPESAATSQVHIYALRLSALIPLLNRVLPLNKLNEQMSIELTCESVDRCMVCAENPTVTVPNYSVRNVQLHYSILTMSSEWESLWNRTLSAAPLTISFENMSNFSDNSFTSGANTYSQQLPFRFQSLIALEKVLRDRTKVISYLEPDKLAEYPTALVTESYYTIDGVRFPLDAKGPGLSDWAIDWLDAHNKKAHDDVRGLSAWRGPFIVGAGNTAPFLAQSLPQSFVTAQFVGQHPKEQSDAMILVPQGINTSRGGTSIILEEKYVTGSTAYETQHFARHVDSLKINLNGTVQFYQ